MCASDAGLAARTAQSVTSARGGPRCARRRASGRNRFVLQGSWGRRASHRRNLPTRRGGAEARGPALPWCGDWGFWPSNRPEPPFTSPCKEAAHASCPLSPPRSYADLPRAPAAPAIQRDTGWRGVPRVVRLSYIGWVTACSRSRSRWPFASGWRTEQASTWNLAASAWRQWLGFAPRTGWPHGGAQPAAECTARWMEQQVGLQDEPDLPWFAIGNPLTV